MNNKWYAVIMFFSGSGIVFSILVILALINAVLGGSVCISQPEWLRLWLAK